MHLPGTMESLEISPYLIFSDSSLKVSGHTVRIHWVEERACPFRSVSSFEPLWALCLHLWGFFTWGYCEADWSVTWLGPTSWVPNLLGGESEMLMTRLQHGCSAVSELFMPCSGAFVMGRACGSGVANDVCVVDPLVVLRWKGLRPLFFQAYCFCLIFLMFECEVVQIWSASDFLFRFINEFRP